MRWLVSTVGAVAVIAAATGWIITRPRTIDPEELAGLVPDPVRGAYVFHAAGCASCHAAEKAEGKDLLRLGGGRRFVSGFGTFYAPNISSDPDQGIGAWSDADLANALLYGTGRNGEHLYPAMPYPAYARMTPSDIVSLRAYLATLPPMTQPNHPQEVSLPFSLRRGVGLWNLLYTDSRWVMAEVPADAETGRSLVEALAHCGECHTPRNALGGLERGVWLSGAPNPAGTGRTPDITPGKLTWSEDEIVAYLQSGFTPEFDTAGGAMAEVVTNLAMLPEEDVHSIARYLKALPPSSGH